MCNINKKSYFETKTVYKAVKKIDGRYFSFYSGFEIKVGSVDPNWTLSDENFVGIKCKWKPIIWLAVRPYLESMPLWNKNIVGKVTGFGSEKWARLVFEKTRFHKSNVDFAILKMVLGGDIMHGNAVGICRWIPDNVTTWAGSEILSFEEIYCVGSEFNERGIPKPKEVIPI